MNEAITIPESVTPAGLRVRADIVRKSYGDESCARHLELAADEITRLKSKKNYDDPNLEANSYATATEETTKELKLTLSRGKKVLGYLVMRSENVYDIATHLLHLYDHLEGIK